MNTSLPPTTLFRDNEQRSRACRALLSTAGLGHLWTAVGPTDGARAQIADGGACLPPLHRALLLAAWLFWSEQPSPLRVDELLALPEAAVPTCGLLIAVVYGPKAVDAWLTRPASGGFVAGARQTHAAAAQLFDQARAALAEHRSKAIDFTALPDACALGALHMADYAIARGVAPVENDRLRHRRALQMAVHVLGLFARHSATKAAKASLSSEG
jgi:hypothetical protein